MPRITRAYLEENHADLVEEIRAEGRAEAGESEITDETRIAGSLVSAIEARGAQEGLAAAKEEAATSATTAERARVKAILKLPAKGHEGLVAKAIDEGWDSGRTAEAILAAQGQKAQAHLDALEEDEEDLDAPDAGSAGTDVEADSVEGQALRLRTHSRRLRKQAASD